MSHFKKEAPSLSSSERLKLGLNARLHLITGKGGVGRTSVTVALGEAMASRGFKTLILEPADADGGESMLGRAVEVSMLSEVPLKLKGSLYVGQLVARVGHERFLRSILPIKKLISAALDSKPLSRFLASAPSMYELGLFYHLWLILEESDFDRVIIDLPATGHTLALTQLPAQIERIIRRGNVVEALKKGGEFISDPARCAAWIVTLPERLPVSEALDLAQALTQDRISPTGFIMNRAARSSPNESTRAALHSFYRVNPHALGARSFERVLAYDELADELAEVAIPLRLPESSTIEERARYIGQYWLTSPTSLSVNDGAMDSTLNRPDGPLTNALRALSDSTLKTDKASNIGVDSSVESEEKQALFNEALERLSVIVCCGAGGVGKTTASASIALAGARRGQRVLVLTIDPSKRLAQALGIDRNTPHPIELSEARLKALGVSPPGTLSAWLLDPQHVSDQVVEREAKASAQALMSNLIYREISGMVAGMQEYTAVEALHSFVKSEAYDLIVLDTPPARHALRFLDAPQRVASFLDKRIFKLFVPDRSGLLGKVAAKLIDEVLDRAFGVHTRKELKQFFELFSQILDHLNHNQREMESLFRSAEVSFYLITTAQADVFAEATYFQSQALGRGLQFGGFFLNRYPSTLEESKVLSGLDLEGLTPEDRKEALMIMAPLLETERAHVELSQSALAHLNARGVVFTMPNLGHVASDLMGMGILAERLMGRPLDSPPS